jgi:hypothetical protein
MNKRCRGWRLLAATIGNENHCRSTCRCAYPYTCTVLVLLSY